MLPNLCFKHNCNVIQFATSFIYIQTQLDVPRLDYCVQYSCSYYFTFLDSNILFVNPFQWLITVERIIIINIKDWTL